MKKTLILLCIATLFACTPSRQEKAASLIKDHIYANANDPDSYELIEISEPDSAWSRPETSGQYKLLEATFEKFNEAQKLARAKKDFDEAAVLIDSMQVVNDQLEAYLASFEPKHIGWIVTHKYRGNNALGAKVIGTDLVLFDLDMTKVVEITPTK